MGTSLVAKQWKRKQTCKSFKIQLSCVFEGLGPLPNCRSHFSDQDGIDESSRNPQNTSFMTKQCSEKNDDREFSRITRVSDNQGFPRHRTNYWNITKLQKSDKVVKWLGIRGVTRAQTPYPPQENGFPPSGWGPHTSEPLNPDPTPWIPLSSFRSQNDPNMNP